MKFRGKGTTILRTDASGVGLGERLLQEREGMTFSRDTMPENSILRAKAFASKNLPAAAT